jgi:hypothetical protein
MSRTLGGWYVTGSSVILWRVNHSVHAKGVWQLNILLAAIGHVRDLDHGLGLRPQMPVSNKLSAHYT